MGGTKIEWADEIFNPITGCSPVSPGCKNCYAARFAKRLHGRYGYPDKNPFQITFHDDRMSKPLRWRKRRRIFLGSMTDLFHDDVTDEMRDKVFGLVAAFACLENMKHHTFIVLTKRPVQMAQYFGAMGPKFHTPSDLFRRWGEAANGYVHLKDGDLLASELVWSWWHAQREQRSNAHRMWPLPNLWLGVSVENQLEADTRIPIVLGIQAALILVSIEPMLESVDPFGVPRNMPFDGYRKNDIGWVICGAETGAGARPMEICAATHLRDSCIEAEVPFFFKKDSNKSPLLNGREWHQFPEV